MDNPAAASLPTRLPALSRARVLVVGDAMLDRYVYGVVERISPEAPIAVLRVERETAMLGGAGNVARNVAALGAGACLVTVAGNDPAGHEIAALMGAESAIESQLVVDTGRTSTVKSRFVGGTQQLLRADRETVAPLSERARADALSRVDLSLGECDVVVLSDYGKGMLAGGFAQEMIKRSKIAGRRVIVDPKQRDYTAYAGADLLTPNRHELAEASGLACVEDEEIEAAASGLIARHGFGGMLVTRGPRGMSLVRPGQPTLHVASLAREVFDVSGAGDTAIAALAAALAAGFALEEAVPLANAAAGIVVAKLGTATCTLAELAGAIAGAAAGHSAKIADAARLEAELARWRHAGLRVGFTNGCFDLLHPGHVALMRQARAACDRLVVGLNADASVRRLKGPTRPVNDERARAAVLASLADVDLVAVFEEDTPLRLIEAVRPDVLVKGADYTRDTVVGAGLVESWGGKVVLAELSPGFSTTAMIGRLAGG